jgi:hypothetical protein
MLKRFCDRCAAEIPIGQTIGIEAGELMLSERPGTQAFDLCQVCQNELYQWFIKRAPLRR